MKYVVVEKEIIYGTTRIFSVTHPGEFFRWEPDGSAEVWVDKAGKGCCTACSSTPKGMSDSCRHIAAVRRVLKKQVGGPWQ